MISFFKLFRCVCEIKKSLTPIPKMCFKNNQAPLSVINQFVGLWRPSFVSPFEKSDE
jgi:hypothetical protein